MTLWSDIRQGGRRLVTDWGFTLAAVTTLALGIAVNVVVFTLLNGALLRDLPFSDPDRIVDIRVFHRDQPQQPISEASYLDARDWNASVADFDGIGAADEQTMNVSDQGRPAERFEGAFISGNGFSLIGARPVLGRDFRAEDDRIGATPVVILGHSVWHSRYAADPTVVGRTIRVNGIPSVVIGVMAEGFGFPGTSEIWQPLALLPPGHQPSDGTARGSVPRRHRRTDPCVVRSADGSRGDRAPHRLRQRGQSAPLPRGGAGARSVGPNVDGRQPLAHRAAAPRRTSAAGARGRRLRPGTVHRRRSPVLDLFVRQPSAVLVALPVRLACVRLSGGSLFRDVDPVRTAAVAADGSHQPGRGFERGWPRRRGRPPEPALERRADRRPGRAHPRTALRRARRRAERCRAERTEGRRRYVTADAAAARSAGHDLRHARTACRLLSPARGSARRCGEASDAGQRAATGRRAPARGGASGHLHPRHAARRHPGHDRRAILRHHRRSRAAAAPSSTNGLQPSSFPARTPSGSGSACSTRWSLADRLRAPASG